MKIGDDTNHVSVHSHTHPQVTYHAVASRSHGHQLRVELDAVSGCCVSPVQHSHTLATVPRPHMYSAILGTCMHGKQCNVTGQPETQDVTRKDVFRVWSEASLESQVVVVDMTLEWVPYSGSVESAVSGGGGGGGQWEHGVSVGSVEVWLTVSVFNSWPLKASTSFNWPMFIETRIFFPSLLNFNPVHSTPAKSCLTWKVPNGPWNGNHIMQSLHQRLTSFTLSNVLRSYSLSCLESIPAAKMSPSGSILTTGRPLRCINPWQFGERRSHSRMVLSNDPEMKVSLTGDICKATTLRGCGERDCTHTHAHTHIQSTHALTYRFVWPGK